MNMSNVILRDEDSNQIYVCEINDCNSLEYEVESAKITMHEKLGISLSVVGIESEEHKEGCLCI